MKSIYVICVILSSVSSFFPKTLFSNNILKKKIPKKILSKTYAVKPETEWDFYGDTAPLEYFDPFNFLKDKSENYIKNVREAELQHGRIAMFAFACLSFIDIISPDNKLAVNYLSSTSIPNQLFVLSIFTCFEFFRMFINYENPFKNENTFTIKKGNQPGKYTNMEVSDYLKNAEINNGRLAMFGTLGYMAEELVTKISIF